jgi:hypothetical protein
MRAFLVLQAIVLSLPAFADSHWLSRLSVCTAGLARETAGIFPLAAGPDSTSTQRELMKKNFGAHAFAFVGTNAKKAGLWVVTGSKAFFAPMEEARSEKDSKGKQVFKVRVNMPDKPAIEMSFTYLTSPLGATGLIEKTAAPDVPESKLATADKAKTQAAAKEYLTDDLREQMKEKVMLSLDDLNQLYAPKTDDQKAELGKKYAQIREKLNQAQGRMFRLLHPFAKDKDDLLDAKIIVPKEALEESLRECRKALQDDKDFSDIAGMAALLSHYLDTASDGNLQTPADAVPEKSI